ncbi:MAG: sugar phosphate isomerase/epimerase family protein [Nitrospinota bacterium]
MRGGTAGGRVRRFHLPRPWAHVPGRRPGRGETSRIAFATTSLGWGTTLPEAIRFAAENAFGGVEVMADNPLLHPDLLGHPARREARRLAEDAGISLSLHVPLSMNNIASHLPGQRRESLRELLAAIELAADLGAGVVVVHPGRLAIENLVTSWTDVAPRMQEVVDLARELGGPWVGVCFDVAHAHLAETVEGALAAAPGELLFHWHLHDSQGQKDEHLELGRGTVSFTPCIPRMRASRALLALEVLGEEGDPPGALARSRAWLERLLAA